MNRRDFTKLGAASIGAALSGYSYADAPGKVVAPSTGNWHFAVIADTHIIDDFYRGPEGNAEDTETIFKTKDRLIYARDVINGLKPKMEQVFVVGDCFHNYPSTDYDFYFQNKTRIDIAREIYDGFTMPVHLGFGNHDYDGHANGVSREMTHRLFEQKLRTKPYYAVDYKGFRFLHLNNFLGETWDPKTLAKTQGTGSLGEEQLNWAEAQLAERKPTVVFIHYPLWIQMPTEVKDYGVHPLIRKYKDSIQMVISGHWHKWVDFAHTYGPQHYVMGATRYDQNASMIFEVDQKKQTLRWLNADTVEWSTHYSKPYKVSV